MPGEVNNNLANNVQQLGAGESRLDTTVGQVGSNVEDLEDLLAMAYAAADTNQLLQRPEAQALIAQFGLTSKIGTGSSQMGITGVQQLVQSKLNRAITSLQNLMTTIKARFDIMREGIRNLSVR